MSKTAPGGFIIDYFRDLGIFRTVSLDETVPFDLQEKCPACETPLKVYCTLIALRTGRRLRMGCCEDCGYSGYIDRPHAQWMQAFYTEKWDQAQERNAEREARTVRARFHRNQRAAVHLAMAFEIDRARPVVDIGCGYGAVLKEFGRLGFTNLIGVEHSRFRAEFVRRAYGFPVVSGNFEGAMVEGELASRAPIGVFFSHHVIEHVYHPAEMIRTASGLQGHGDYLILAMPDGERESPTNTLFWLPHLHSFTHASVERLLNRHGYEIIEENPDFPGNLIFAAKKVASPKARFSARRDKYQQALEKLCTYFELERIEAGHRYTFFWGKRNGTYVTLLEELTTSAWRDRLGLGLRQVYDFFQAHVLGKFTKKHSFALRPLEKRFTSPEESPIEVQFSNNITLLVR